MNNLKIRTRLSLSFSVILIFSILIAAVSLNGLFDSNRNLNDFINGSFTADSAVKICRIETNNAARAIRDMAIDNNKNNYSSYKATVDENVNNLKSHIIILKESFKDNTSIVNEYENAINEWIEIGYRTIEEIENGNKTKAVEILLNECTPTLQKIVDVATKIDGETGEMEKVALKQNKDTTSFVRIVVILMLAISLILSGVISIKVTKGIVKPLKEIETAALELSKGNLNSEIEYSSKDELGNLADSMRQSVKTLALYISDIDNMMDTMAKGDFNISVSQPFVGDFENIEKSVNHFTDNMSDTLLQINIASDQVAGGSEQVSQGAQILSQGASEQASSVQELSATISEITEQINKSAQNAKRANQLVGDTEEEVSNGNVKMQEMIVAMSEISEKSNEISKIIKTIEEIARQTNILALNAAVEAARAGAAGKGFSVVAEEVRNLAQKSSEAAKNTTALIEGSITAVDKGVKMVDETAKSLSAVVEKTSNIRRSMDEIAGAAAYQAEGANQVTLGIEQISSVVQANSATAEQSAAASEELNSQSAMLKDLISQFKLKKM